MNDLKLGLIGISPGNGHPYSWSAIINGYDAEAMEDCGFPAIPRYLEEQVWPEAQIAGAQVTHIWTQDAVKSRAIARASCISEVVNEPDDLIGLVDAILLARDDAAQHLTYAAPFLEAGVPIYIDKPIATNRVGLKALRSREQYPGQIFTCSALRLRQRCSCRTNSADASDGSTGSKRQPRKRGTRTRCISLNPSR